MRHFKNNYPYSRSETEVNNLLSLSSIWFLRVSILAFNFNSPFDGPLLFTSCISYVRGRKIMRELWTHRSDIVWIHVRVDQINIANTPLWDPPVGDDIQSLVLGIYLAIFELKKSSWHLSCGLPKMAKSRNHSSAESVHTLIPWWKYLVRLVLVRKKCVCWLRRGKFGTKRGRVFGVWWWGWCWIECNQWLHKMENFSVKFENSGGPARPAPFLTLIWPKPIPALEEEINWWWMGHATG